MGFRRMLPHVKPKNKSGWLRYRRRFPMELVDVLGKEAHIKDLGTRCYVEAEPLAQIENGIWLRLIEGARLNAGTSRNERLKVLHDLQSYGLAAGLEDIDPFMIAELREKVSLLLDSVVKRGVTQSLSDNKSLTDYNPRPAVAQKVLTELTKKLRLYEQMYREKGFEPSKYLEGKHNKLTIPYNEQGKLENILRVDLPALATPLVDATTQYRNDDNAMLLSQALKEWELHKKRKPDTLREWRSAVNLFIGLYGDLPISRIEKNPHAKGLRDYLMRVPIVIPHGYKSRKPIELLELARKGEFEDCATRKSGTVKKYIVALNSIFNVLIDNADYKENNPFSRMLPDDGDEQERLPFADDELVLIFNSPIYIGFGNYRHRPGSTITRDEQFWLPLLALFSGARPSELAQLTIADIGQRDDVWFLSISNAGRRKKRANASIKTKNAQRTIPIHSELVRCGFLRYVEELRTQGKQQLFPNFDISKGSRASKEYSRIFARYCEQIAKGTNTSIIEEKKTFYCFRHRFKDEMLEAEIPTGVQKHFMGHAFNKANMDGQYGQGYSTKALKRNIEKIKYPFLDLSHLHMKDKPDPEKPKEAVEVTA